MNGGLALFISCALGAAAWLMPVAASAHFLKTDGSIGVVLHADPGDVPVAGRTSDFYVDIKDKEDKFGFAGCDCQAAVLRDGTTLFSQSLAAPSFSYAFPTPAIYQVRISGKPLQEGGFQPFAVTYDFRVERQAGTPVESFLPYIVITLAAILVTAAFIRNKH